MMQKLQTKLTNKAAGQHVLSAQNGFTLVEIIISFAIVAIVSVAVITTVIGMVGIQQRDNQARSDNASVEASIASEEDPTQSLNELDFSLGGYSLPSTVDTYSSGLGSYTLLNPTSDNEPETVRLDGDAAYTRTYKVPLTGYYRIEVWGASGGAVINSASGGSGGYASGIILLREGEQLYLHAGGRGGNGGVGSGGAAGENGGGAGGRATSYTFLFNGGGGGGGASDVRIGSDSLNSRVIVAGGGGGAGSFTGTTGAGGAGAGNGGGLSGSNGQGDSDGFGFGGTQNLGGSGAFGSSFSTHGSFGTGGSVTTGIDTVGGGGGGGWYGGGSGFTGGGGGGCGWVFTQSTYYSWYGVEKTSYTLADSYWLVSTSLVSGNAAMPDPRSDTGSHMVGMNGNGYVTVSWVGVTYE